ncbi:MAG: carboxypeptidase regulatory-like domain-containing protein [Rhodopirellula sp.]|nr:carboxypeptidase regulatory-like domain-containing protein [Rhodopirellula sp.]
MAATVKSKKDPHWPPFSTLFLSSCLAVLAGSGCHSGRPETVAVTGTVTYRGQPVEGATVTFYADKNRPAYGTTDAAGRFQLTTFSPNDGVVAGTHKVTIVKLKPVAARNAPGVLYVREIKSDDGKTMAMLLGGYLPERYGNLLKTPLTATIHPRSTQELQFALDEG